MDLLPGDVISDSIAFTGIYDLPLTRKLSTLAREGGVLVDVGANLGYFSLLWLSARDDNSVVAFEPSRRNIQLLNRNISQNCFMHRVDIRADAVSNDDGEMEFDAGPQKQTGWGRIVRASTERSYRVRTVRLDKALPCSERVSLLKIDVEGADTWVLQGAEALLRNHRINHIWWEQNKPCMHELGISEDEAACLLKSVGYKPIAQSNPRANCVAWSACPVDEG
jgi:FkbM family methyltransferase